MKGLVDTFNQGKALVGAFPVIVKSSRTFVERSTPRPEPRTCHNLDEMLDIDTAIFQAEVRIRRSEARAAAAGGHQAPRGIRQQLHRSLAQGEDLWILR